MYISNKVKLQIIKLCTLYSDRKQDGNTKVNDELKIACVQLLTLLQ